MHPIGIEKVSHDAPKCKSILAQPISEMHFSITISTVVTLIYMVLICGDRCLILI